MTSAEPQLAATSTGYSVSSSAYGIEGAIWITVAMRMPPTTNAAKRSASERVDPIGWGTGAF
jgi:hypothetical protein